MGVFEWMAIVGVAAWVPQLVRLWKDFVATPSISIVTESTVELGFTTYGPILNLRMAFATEGRAIVISGLRIRLKHEGGNERLFHWRGISQHVARISSQDGTSMPLDKEQSVLAIKLKPDEVEERLIRFQEQAFHDGKAFHDTNIQKRALHLYASDSLNANEYLQSAEVLDSISFIKQWFNWSEGKYTITFELESNAKFKLTRNEYTFTLNPIDIELLDRNRDYVSLAYADEVRTLLQEQGELHNVVWMWRNPKLSRVT